MPGRAIRMSVPWDRGLRWRGTEADGLLARPDRPSRCTFPITELREMPPSSAAIWEADNPSLHSFLRTSTRSSVQFMALPSLAPVRPLGRIPAHPPDSPKPPSATRCRKKQKTVPSPHEMSYRASKNATIWRDSRARVATRCRPHLRSLWEPKRASHPQQISRSRRKEPRCLAPSALQSVRRARARVVDRWLARNTLYLVPPREAAHFVLRAPKTDPARRRGRVGWECLPINIKTEPCREFSPVTNLCASRPGL